MTMHATYRPPSSASRWLSCHGSVQVLQTYDNSPSDASTKGDIAHKLLEDSLEWGVVPDHPDVDIMYGVMMAVEYINDTQKAYGPACKVYAEQTLEIPETGEIGTTDVTMVTADTIHVIDYKNGYVPVDVKMNAQLMLYLLSLMHKYGERKHYKLTVIQPNYVHVDGMIRHFEPTPDDIEWFRKEVAIAMASQTVTAGKHCKTTYCPARGTCEVFNAWSLENCKLAWFPGETVAMTDEALADALEQAEILQGYRDALRGEAMRRMLQQNRRIRGYKIVKAKKDRAYASDAARGKVLSALAEMGATEDDLFDRKPIGPAGVEKIVKKLFKPQGRGAWLKGMDYIMPPELLEPTNQSLTIEKSIDGRKEYKRGAEFDALSMT